jgi:hypothetical protein
VPQPDAEGWQRPDLPEKKVGVGRTWTAGTAGGGGRRLLAEGDDGEKKEPELVPTGPRGGRALGPGLAVRRLGEGTEKGGAMGGNAGASDHGDISRGGINEMEDRTSSALLQRAIGSRSEEGHREARQSAADEISMDEQERRRPSMESWDWMEQGSAKRWCPRQHSTMEEQRQGAEREKPELVGRDTARARAGHGDLLLGKSHARAERVTARC